MSVTSDQDTVLEFLALLRGDLRDQDASGRLIEEAFTHGDCGRMALMIEFIVPGARMMYSKEERHVVAVVDGKMMDVFGFHESGAKDWADVDREFLHRQDLVNNYSVELRGPAV